MTALKPLVTDAGTTQQIQAGDQLEVNAGSAAAPALTIDGDTNTGIYSPGADQLAVSTAGTQRVTVDASGNVGVGTVPTTSKLTVDGGTAADSILFVKSNVNGNTAITAQNDTSGSAAQASLYLISDGPAGRYSSFAVTSNGWTSNGLSLPNQYQSHPDQGLTNGMLFATEAANAPIVFAVPTVNGAGYLTSSERLRVNGSEIAVNDGAQDVDFRAESQTNPYMLFVDASANIVSVGTVAPGSLVTNVGYPFNTVAEGANNAALAAWTFGSATPETAAKMAMERARGTAASPSALAAGDVIGEIVFNGFTNQRVAAVQILGFAGTGWGASGSDAPGRLEFRTAPDGSATPVERFEINAGVEAVVNDPQNDFDFRVATTAGANSLFVDGGSGNVGVGVLPANLNSTLQVAGSLALAITTVSTGTTLDATHYTVLCDTSGGGFTVTLPAAATCAGRVYVVKNKSTNTATVQGNGAETIDGSNTYALSTQWQSVTIQSDGTAWFVL
ncbi:MAG: hypothetical protein EBT03_07385 [Betaproteobacteria bacterium]|nr:hypothetical protein [Betaproteobacteria bacterium]NCA16492.1 hypothetical protein [Betaproteobacteria bacterium]